MHTFIKFLSLQVRDGVCEVWGTCFFVMASVVDEFFNVLGHDIMLCRKVVDLLLASCNKGDDITRKQVPSFLVALHCDFLRSFLGIGGLCPNPHRLHGFMWVALCPSVSS